MEPAEPAGGEHRPPAGRTIRTSRGEAQRRAPQSLTRRGDGRHHNAKHTRCFGSAPGGGPYPPPAWRDGPPGNSASSRRTPHSPRCAAPRLTPGAAARPVETTAPDVQRAQRRAPCATTQPRRLRRPGLAERAVFPPLPPPPYSPSRRLGRPRGELARGAGGGLTAARFGDSRGFMNRHQPSPRERGGRSPRPGSVTDLVSFPLLRLHRQGGGRLGSGGAGRAAQGPRGPRSLVGKASALAGCALPAAGGAQKCGSGSRPSTNHGN